MVHKGVFVMLTKTEIVKKMVDKCLRGGRSRFVVESKLFEIVVEDSGGKLKGCI